MSPTLPTRKSGQTLIFMTMVVVMIAFAALFYFDVHKALHVKAVSRNSGDAAALAGARWQAVSMNTIGSLNVAQAMAHLESLSAGQAQSAEAEAISELQKRLTFSGPIFGFLAAQQAAKNNGLFNQPEFEEDLFTHINIVLNEYVDFYPEPFEPTPPFTNAWEEYADMLSLLAEHGLAVNAGWQYYRGYSHSNHLLLNPSFYDAIAGRSWCWFFHNAYDELQNYSSYMDWPALPPIQVAPPVNSEVFSLHLRRVRVRDSVPVLPPESDWADLMRDLRDRIESADPEIMEDFDADWAHYASGPWSSWTGRIPSHFPWEGEVREEYDYAGADAAIVVRTETERHTGFRGGDVINWTAGAKPFGSLPGDEGGRVRPNSHGLVLPAYTDVRLIPIDTTVSGGNGALRPGWLEFIMLYLPQYMEHGPSVLPAHNWYANQLRTWEIAAFRQAGLDWLAVNSASCDQPGGGGGGGSGGTFHGH